MGAGRPSRIADPEFAKLVAEVYVSGASRDEMCETLDCDRNSLRRWVRDPRVQVYATNLTKERVIRITRRIDAEMDGRLAHVSKWDLKDLLLVRKEYLERALQNDHTGTNVAETTEELSEAMDNDPDLAKALTDLLGG